MTTHPTESDVESAVEGVSNYVSEQGQHWHSMYGECFGVVIDAAREAVGLREKLEIETASNGISKRQFTAMQKENTHLKEAYADLVKTAATANRNNALEIHRLKAELAKQPERKSWYYFCRMFGLHPNSAKQWNERYPQGIVITDDKGE